MAMHIQLRAVEKRIERLVGPSQQLNVIDGELMTTLQNNLVASYKDEMQERVFSRMGKQATRDRLLDVCGCKISEMDTRDEHMTTKRNQLKRMQKAFPSHFRKDSQHMLVQIEGLPYDQPFESLLLEEEEESKHKEDISKLYVKKEEMYAKHKNPVLQHMDEKKTIQQLYEMADAIVWYKEIPEDLIPGTCQPKRPFISKEPRKFRPTPEKEGTGILGEGNELSSSEESSDEESSSEEEVEEKVAEMKPSCSTGVEISGSKEEQPVKENDLEEVLSKKKMPSLSENDEMSNVYERELNEGSEEHGNQQSTSSIREDTTEAQPMRKITELSKDLSLLTSSEMKSTTADISEQGFKKEEDLGEETMQEEVRLASSEKDEIVTVSSRKAEIKANSSKNEATCDYSKEHYILKENDSSAVFPKQEKTAKTSLMVEKDQMIVSETKDFQARSPVVKQSKPSFRRRESLTLDNILLGEEAVQSEEKATDQTKHQNGMQTPENVGKELDNETMVDEEKDAEANPMGEEM